MIENKPAGFPDRDWQQMSPEGRGFVEQAIERIAQLETELQDVQERLGQNSRNSSCPPSSDRPDQKQEKTQKRNKKGQRQPGGQPGHPGHKRPLKPVEEVDKVVPVKPEQCRHCGAALQGEDPHPHRHQVTEIPPIEPIVTEYQLQTLTCDECGGQIRAELPDGVPRRVFGPRLQSIVSLGSGVYRLSRRQVEQMMADFFKVDLALGSVKNLENDTSEALSEPVEEAKVYVKEQAQANIDETSWSQGNAKGWLWVVVTSLVVVFVIRLSRAGKVAKELLGEEFQGIVNSDRHSAYNWLPLPLRQLCWAHLIRKFQAFVDYGGPSALIGQALLTKTELMFAWWYKLRDEEISRAEFQEKMKPIRTEIVRLLKEGAGCEHQKTAGSCAHILKFEPALWTFIDVEGVEPTNNEAEQEIRSGVIWRKTSFGTQSKTGSLFVERMLTVSATLKRQNRNILDYLTEACTARLHNRPAPSILPPQCQPLPDTL
jgi:transposase